MTPATIFGVSIVCAIALWLIVLTVWAIRADGVVRYQRSGQLLTDLDRLDKRVRAVEGTPQYRDVRVLAPKAPEP